MSESLRPPGAPKRIAILIVAYNAASTLRQVLDRIPESVGEETAEVIVFDDESTDDTYLVGLGYKALHGKSKLSVFRNERNQGYGGNQMLGYRYAIDKGYDAVALIHGDGQYAPEELPKMLAPILSGEADAVFGSRMMTAGAALEGGMPRYKYVGNRILSAFENSLLGTKLSEFHSGYRVYSCAALSRVPFELNTKDFHFDTQIIIQMSAAGMRIVELPIPTYYGDEICHVDGIRYAKDVVKSVLQFKLHSFGIRRAAEYEVRPRYSIKKSLLSSHAQLLSMVGSARYDILDAGCGSGELASLLQDRGHRVTGMDARPPQTQLEKFIQTDLSSGLKLEADQRFDVILFADVLEHLPDSALLLRQARDHLKPGGRILVSLPNVAHWSIRAQLAAGRFEYADQGILDRGHLRFFTDRSARQLFAECELVVRDCSVTPVPWEKVTDNAVLHDALEKVDHGLGQLSPKLFAYQHLFMLVPDPEADREPRVESS